MKKNLLKLANLDLTNQEFKKYSKDLDSILDYVSEISKLNLKNIQPTTNATGLENIMRQDKIKILDFNHNPGQYFKTKSRIL